MKILVTGSGGFVGKNLVAVLKCIADGRDKSRPIGQDIEIYEYDIDTSPELLDRYCRDCDFVFNLAGVNRPQNTEEFMAGNFGFASTLLDTLKKHGNKCPVMLSSSTQALLDNPYGISKKAGEELFFEYAEQTGAEAYVYRFPNLFGKWCRPNYNSAVATFCHNISHELPINVNDRSTVLTLVYIDDLVNELINALVGKPTRDGRYCRVGVEYKVTLGQIVDLLYSFKSSREKRTLASTADGFEKKLYSTYLSYIAPDNYSYPLKMNVDMRGSFTEIIRTAERGQFSVNVSKPHIVKGNHWHNTKNEKFLVVSGSGVIRLRRIGDDKIYEYYVSGQRLEVVDIPVGYTHNIENLGQEDMVTFMWANECFDPEHPDTYFEEV